MCVCERECVCVSVGESVCVCESVRERVCVCERDMLVNCAICWSTC